MTRAVFEEGYSKEDARLGHRTSQLERRPFGGGTAIYAIEVFETDTPVVAGDNAFEWEIPEDLDGAALTKVEAYLITPSSSGSVEVQVALEAEPGGGAGTNMLSTPISIQPGHYNSKQSTSQPVVDDTNDDVVWGDHLRIDVDSAGVDATGLGCVLYFTPAPTKALILRGEKGDPGGVTEWEGPWATSTTYSEGDVVSHNGVAYVARVDHTSSAASEPGVGVDWEDYWMVLSEGSQYGMIHVVIYNQGFALDTGTKAFIAIDFDCEIVGHKLLADQVGSCVLDIYKDTYTNHPPTNADSITASSPPTLSSAIKSQDTTLAGWTTAISAGDVLVFNLESVSGIHMLSLNLKVSR